MAEDFIDVPMGNPGARGAGQTIGAVVEVDEGNGRSVRAAPHLTTSGGETVAPRVDAIAVNGGLPGGVREKIQALLDAKKAGATVALDDDPDSPPGETPAEAAAAAGEVKPDAKAAPAAVVVAAPDPLAELQKKIAGYEDANKRLAADLDAERKKPRAEPVALDKLLAAAREGYVEDELGSIRKLIAASLGVEDPKDPAVEAELRDLYTDLTSTVLGVTPDTAHQAKREAARSRRLWDREKRQRKAEEQAQAGKTEQDAQSKAAEAASGFIGNRIAAKAGDYPLTMALAETLDGMKPEQLLWQVIQRETKTGRLDATKPDGELIDDAAKLIEAHYTGIAERISKAKPQPSTAQPKLPAQAQDQTQRQGHGAHTLTTADASVAPATPPATTPAPKKNEKPVFKNDDERKKWALRHLRPSPTK